MSEPAEHAGTTALLDHTIGMLNQLTSEMPPDGGIPPILVSEGPHGVNLMQFVMPGADEDNEETAYAITANIAVLRATDVVFVAGAWLTNPAADSGETPSSTEVVVILHATAAGQRMMFADVTRRDAQPPVIGQWATAPVDETHSLGTFGEAIGYGLRLAADLGTPEQHDARQLVDEILDSDGTKAAMRVMLAIWRQTRRHRAAEFDASYAAYDEWPPDQPDEWGDLTSWRRAAGGS